MSEKIIKLDGSRYKFIFKCLNCGDIYFEEHNLLYMLLSREKISFPTKCISCNSKSRFVLEYKESYIIGEEAI